MKTISINQDKIAVLKLHEEVLAAFNLPNLEKLLSLHTDDIILMEPNIPVITGKAEVKRLFEKFEQQHFTLKLYFTIHELEIFGTRAFVRGQVIKTTIQKDGTAFSEKGKFITLSQKQEDGRWLRTHVIVNSDMPASIVSYSSAGLLLAEKNE